MSKHPKEKFDGNKVMYDKMNATQAKLNLIQNNPIPLKPTTYFPDEYSIHGGDLGTTNVVLWALLEAFLNGQQIDYYIQ